MSADKPIDWEFLSPADFEREQARFHRDLANQIRTENDEADRREAEAARARRFPAER
jgi:hypothetical protein